MFRFFAVISIIIISSISVFSQLSKDKISGAPPDGAPQSETENLDPYNIIREWVRPDGPLKVGIQVGHWEREEAPEELKKLRNNTGANGGGKWEWEVNYEIATLIKDLLEKHEIEVDLLPTTIPPKYWADVFISIHADGSEDPSANGYKFAGPWRDFTGRSDDLVDLLNKEYKSQTGLEYDDNISRNMRGYYAFSWWRYKHSIHPMTTAVIAETGFLTNASDRDLLISNPDIPASAIADALLAFLKAK